MTPDKRFGFIAGMGAYFIWGLLPLYFKLIGHIAPTDILAHRILWSLPTGLILVAFANRWNELWRMLRTRAAFWLLLSAVLIAANWLTYIWAVTQSRVMEASLGYYMNPLVNVAVGAIFLSEKLRRWQWLAVGLATLAVIVETFALGRLPWVALVLCLTFASYAFIRRQVQIDSRVGFTFEVLVLIPAALIWFGSALQSGRNAFGNDGVDLFFLMLSGPITATPLILFALSAKRLRFSTIGIMQYMGPSLQFLVALALGEHLTPLRAVTFTLIWLAVLVFSVDAFGHERRMRVLARPI